MDAFRDEVYDNMDDISKLVEPFEYTVNNELAQFPDEYEVTVDDLLPGVCSQWDKYLNISLEVLVSRKMIELNLLNIAKECRTNWAFCSEMFEFKEIRDDEEVPLEYDPASGTLTGGKLLVVKKKIGLEDNEIEKKMSEYIYNYIRNAFGSASDVDKKRMNEIADLFGATEARKERAWRKKTYKLAAHMQNLVVAKRLIIKDFELFKRMCRWIYLYVHNGNLPALSNITKIKIMSRSGAPIYSIKEEVV